MLFINFWGLARFWVKVLTNLLQGRSLAQLAFNYLHGKSKPVFKLVSNLYTLQSRSQPIKHTSNLNNRNLIVGLSCLLYLGLVMGGIQPVEASIHAYPQSETVTMYRSLQSLRDQYDRSWQLVFFDQVNHGQIETIHLRLVGFPGLELARSPLTLKARTGQMWQVKNLNHSVVTTPSSHQTLPSQLPPNTGEFDLYDVMRSLQEDTVLELKFSLIEGEPVQITVPVAIVREWQALLAKT